MSKTKPQSPFVAAANPTKPKRLNAVDAFFAGALSHALLATVQRNSVHQLFYPQHIVRRGLQGGIAIGCGAAAYNHFSEKQTAEGIATIAAGALAMWLTEKI
ncbi:hypothetical protein [Chrysiogenes arsenatis]|uniref:hypothetical protein n=1 Tax=Chrysiogenes arsenatis TaxID=309797 RepID=UPI00047FDC65|nr:hypothetical protein [Chrysiogenes arsenatis]